MKVGFRYKSPKWTDFEKPDIIDVLEALGVTDLKEHGSGDKTYLNGPCPLHRAERNFTTFVVWPNIQQCACMSCSKEPMDVIDLWMKIKRVSFAEAVKAICSPLTTDQAVLKRIQAEHNYQPSPDMRFYAERIRNLFEVLDFVPARNALIKVNEAIMAGRMTLADSILQAGGV